jgi:glycosyltransferase involved in cell wall biosynthesis
MCESGQRSYYLYPNIRYYRQKENIGALRNFAFCLSLAKTDFFCFLGAHDLISSNYLDILVPLLENTPEAVLAFSPSTYIDKNGTMLKTALSNYYEKLLHPYSYIRCMTIIKDLSDWSVFHGVFKTEALRKVWYNHPCLGFDQVVLCGIASLGPILRSTSTIHFSRVVHDCQSSNASKEQLIRVQGKITNQAVSSSRKQMIEGQIEIMQNLSYPSWFSKVYYVLKAEYFLNLRFGRKRKLLRFIVYFIFSKKILSLRKLLYLKTS